VPTGAAYLAAFQLQGQEHPTLENHKYREAFFLSSAQVADPTGDWFNGTTCYLGIEHGPIDCHRPDAELDQAWQRID
jgi:hypothetical protein